MLKRGLKMRVCRFTLRQTRIFCFSAIQDIVDFYLILHIYNKLEENLKTCLLKIQEKIEQKFAFFFLLW